MFSRVARPSQFTKLLTPDAAVPTIEASEAASPELLRKARLVKGSFTWLIPEQRPEFELKWLSEVALKDLNLEVDGSPETMKEFSEVLSGYKPVIDHKQQLYPFAQNYAGDQFGTWAGQLGDGRAITLFKIGNYEIQLKGAGMTPYSRFADGKAVLRSSIREALASEYLNMLGIPTQRCLSLVNLPKTIAQRETQETCAVIARMAESWVRIGSFQLHHSRGNHDELRKLADYCISALKLGSAGGADGGADGQGNRYFQLFRDAALRNARMMSQCQAYGFLNGVLNTDNVSILGLSIDYGPFAFMDTFDPQYTPNHDDYMSRYGFRSAPVVMWWNCVKLGETLGALIGCGDKVDDPEYLAKLFSKSELSSEVTDLATRLIMGVGDEFQEVYETEYQKLMMRRIGVTNSEEAGDKKLIEELLTAMKECEIDYNTFFRKLSDPNLDPLTLIPEQRERKAMVSDKDAAQLVTDWFEKYRVRKDRDPISESERIDQLKKINPNFVLRNSVMANVIDLAQRGNWEAFDAVTKMVLNPFADSWNNVPDIYVNRFLSPISPNERDSQLSCSS